MKNRFITAVLCLLLTLTSFAVPVSAAEISTDALRGDGMVAAVLDSGFDISGDYFQLPPSTNVKLTPAGTAKLVKVTSAYEKYPSEAKGSYISAKIPFAFSYVTGGTDIMSANTHGTNTAAIIGAFTAERPDSPNTAAVRPNGEAARVQLLLMRISSGEYGNSEARSEDVCAAISDAVILGADVIFINTVQSPNLACDEDFIAAVKKAEQSGVAVFCGAGENGNAGTGSVYDTVYGIKSPVAQYAAMGNQSNFSSVPSLVTVASSQLTQNGDNFFILGRGEYPEEEEFEEFLANNLFTYSDTNAENNTADGKSFSLTFAEIGTVEYVPIGGIGSEEDFAALEGGILDGKIALIARGEIYFTEKIANAEKYGAAGVIIYESNPEELSWIYMDISGASTPAVFIAYEDGLRLLEAEDKVITFPEIDRETMDMSVNASTGATSALTIGPSFTVKGNLTSISGTSFSAAKGAGIFVAAKEYLMKRYPSETPDEKNALMNLTLAVMASSAQTQTDEDNGEISPRKQGSGATDYSLISAAEAIIYNTETSKTQTNLGQSKKAFTKGGEFAKLNLTVENISDRTVSYDLSVSVLTDGFIDYNRDELNEQANMLYSVMGIHADELYNLDTSKPLPTFLTGKSALYEGASVSLADSSLKLNSSSEGFAPKKITLAPGQKVALDLRIILSASSVKKYSEIFTNGFFVEGFVTLTPADGNGTTLSHPYMGFCGDWTKTPLTAPTIYKDSSSFHTDNHLSVNIDSDYYEGVVMLGQNYLISVDGDAMINNELLTAVNPFITYDGADHPSGLCWKISPLREISSHKVVIRSKDTGKIVHQASLGGIEKSTADSFGSLIPHVEQLWTCAASDNIAYVYPDGRYTCEVTLTSVFFGSEKAVQTISFDFSIDTTPPEILSVEFKEADGKKHFEVTAKDENYIQFILVHDGYDNFTCLDEELLKPKFTEADGRGEPVTLTFDASYFYGDEDEEYQAPAVYVEIVDYAHNSTVRKIPRAEIGS